MNLLRRGPFERRSAAGVVLVLFVAVGLVLVFGGTLTRSTDIAAEAAKIQADVDLLNARAEAGRAELEFLETDAFVEQVARQIGMGEPDEQPFALGSGAPSPRPIVALGAAERNGQAAAPFDAWMELLFGA